MVDLLNALRSSGRARTAWVAGTVLAIGIVVLAQLSVFNMRLALGG